MVCESSDETISIHKTKQGARNALAKFVRKEYESYKKRYGYDVNEMPYIFGEFEEWRVNETELLD